MTQFLLCAVLLLALGLAFVLWPLLRGGGRRGSARDRAVVSVYRDQLRELHADHANSSISDEQFENGRRELERRLLEEIAQPTHGAAVSRKVGWTAAAIGAFVLVVPIGLYLALGTPEAISPGPFASRAEGGGQEAAGEKAGGGEKGAPHPITPEQVKAMVDKLAKHLEQNPRDGDGWVMLARSYGYMREFPEAVKAFQKAIELRPKDARLLADYADALAMTQGQTLAGEPMKMVQRALAIDPKDVKALALAGTDAFDRKDYPAAVGFWERAVKAGPPDPQFTQQLQTGLDEARKLAGIEAPPPLEASTPPSRAMAAREAEAEPAAGAPASSGAIVKGRVQLAATLAAKAAPNDTVFVFARATQGPRMPLALLKRQVKDLPLEFALDDSMAMMPNMKLSNYSTVVIGARVSKGGDAMPSSGDLQGFSDPVKVGSSGVSVKIDQVVP
jgi:cytochrome c-type biogenesis protein CcmH